MASQTIMSDLLQEPEEVEILATHVARMMVEQSRPTEIETLESRLNYIQGEINFKANYTSGRNVGLFLGIGIGVMLGLFLASKGSEE